MVDEQKSLEAGDVISCNVHNPDKLDEVAKVNHIFCDKTGTLTQNKLIFRTLTFGQTMF